MQETLLVDLIEQTTLSIPRRDGRQVLLTLLLRSKIANLDNGQGIFALRPGSKKYVGIKLPWSSFDAVAEMFDERWRGSFIESAFNASQQARKVRSNC